MKLRILPFLTAVAIILVLIMETPPGITRAEPPTPTPAPGMQASSSSDPLAEALQQAIASHPEVMAFALNNISIDRVQVTPDGSLALIFLAMHDLQTGRLIVSEPGLAIAARTPEGTWQVTLQADADWVEKLQALPDELIEPQEKALYMPLPQSKDMEAVQSPLTGYLLPWAGGAGKVLTQSIGHVYIYGNCSSCLYAFDFWDGTRFPLLASKGGTVFAAQWSVPNDNHANTNYLIVKDVTTTPVSYMIYYHMAQDTIPVELRTPGAVIYQGQYIGNVDNTGASTGNHLHFQVHTNPYGYWGDAVDFTFSDVKVNGGRPRTCQETRLPSYLTGYYGQCQTDDYYVSGNHGANPPTGGLTSPADGLTVTSSSIDVSGWGRDDLGVTRLQVLANYDGAWREVGPSQTATPFSFTLDPCAAGIPDGPVSLALRVWDKEGNQTLAPLTVRRLLNKAACPAPPPPPTCTPNADQAALYVGRDFSGACKLFGMGSYADDNALGIVGNGNAASIKLGSNVSATLYSGPNYSKRAETLSTSDRDLGDNRVPAGAVTSLRVQSRSANPNPPVLTTPQNSLDQAPTSADSLVLAWNDGGGATKFTAELYQGVVGGTPYRSMGYQAVNSWSVGNLPVGSYTWRVMGRVANAKNDPYYSAWSQTTFTVASPVFSSPASTAFPFSDDLESGAGAWSATGLWRLAQVDDGAGGTTHAWVFNNGSNYADPTVRAGDLTSAPIPLPAGGPYYLRFSSRYQSESRGTAWDQRRVQFACDGGNFVSAGTPYDLLSSDPMQAWLKDIAIPIPAECSGKSLRVRFHFDIIDSQLNSYQGWMLDNLSVSAVPQPASGDTNDNLSTATPIQYGGAISGAILPGGDVDYYQFSASAGEVVLAGATATGSKPLLDPVLALIDSDKSYILLENDDLVRGTITDSRLSYRIPANGTYYLRVRAWDHPSGSGSYDLSLQKLQDNTAPVVALSNPNANGYLMQPDHLSVTATEAAGSSGVSHVDFYWHLADWATENWIPLGSDWNPADGWGVDLDPSLLPTSGGMAFWARACDWASNCTDVVVWNIQDDHTPPSSSLSPLPLTTNGTAILLTWSATDGGAGPDHFDIQVQDNGGAWQDWRQDIPGGLRKAWFVGAYGHSYGFRLRVVDRAGNTEAYPSTAESYTTLVDDGGSDPNEADGTQAQAHEITPDSKRQAHTFYGVADQDWLWFNATAGKLYVIQVLPGISSPAAASISLWASGGASPLAQNSAPGLGQPATLAWKAPASGKYYLRLQSIDPQVAGETAEYQAWVDTGYHLFFPAVRK